MSHAAARTTHRELAAAQGEQNERLQRRLDVAIDMLDAAKGCVVDSGCTHNEDGVECRDCIRAEIERRADAPSRDRR